MKKSDKSTVSIGREGESFAAEYLEKNGYRLLCRNYKGAHGELDIIAEKGAYIVFAEVKTRRAQTQRPAEAVDFKKLSHIMDCAEEFLREYRDNEYICSLKPRFDVVEVFCFNGIPKECIHIADILDNGYN